jgi:hypothetical protein
MFRVSHKGDGIDDADTIDGARAIVRGQPLGRYDVDEIRAELSYPGRARPEFQLLLLDLPMSRDPFARPH